MLKSYTISVLVEEVHGEVRYTAGVKEMPGCFTEASNLQELLINLHDAMSLWLEASEESNEVESQQEQKRNVFEANDAGLEDR